MKQSRRGFRHSKENSELHILDFRFIFRFRDLFSPLEAFKVVLGPVGKSYIGKTKTYTFIALFLCPKFTGFSGNRGVKKQKPFFIVLVRLSCIFQHPENALIL